MSTNRSGGDLVLCSSHDRRRSVEGQAKLGASVLLDELVARSGSDDPAAMQHRYGSRQLLDFTEVVRRINNARALLGTSPDDIDQPSAATRHPIRPSVRRETTASGSSARWRCAPDAFLRRQLPASTVGEPLEVHRVQHFLRVASASCRRRSPPIRPKYSRFCPDRQRRIDAGILRHESNDGSSALGMWTASWPNTVIAPESGRIRPMTMDRDRRLPAPLTPNEREHFAFPHVEVDAGQRVDRSVGLAQPANRRPPRSSSCRPPCASARLPRHSPLAVARSVA